MSNAVNQASPSENYDAQQAVEEIKEGDRKAPTANVEADYEASKEFSTSPIDQTEEGTAAAAAATSSQLNVPKPTATASSLDSTGKPDAYKEMAQNVSSTPDGASNASIDDLYQKAVEKGKAGE